MVRGTLGGRLRALAGSTVCAGGLILLALGAALALAQLSRGIDGAFDTPSYWSATEATASGHWYSTTLQPGFSSHSVIDFLDRGGRLPFTDLAYGYPFVCGVLAAVLGSGRAAMTAVTCLAVGTTVALIGIGPATSNRSRSAIALRSVAALVLVASPTYRMVTRGALTEPVFCTLVLGFVLCAAADDGGRRRLGRAGVLAAAAGLVRFVGVGLAGVVYLVARRHRSRRASALWAASTAAPAVVLAAVGSALGGGHGASWRGFHDYDLRLFARSVAGWVDARQGNPANTYGGDGAAWWAWPVAAAWLVLVIVAALRFHRSRRWSGATWRRDAATMICWTSAAAFVAVLVLSIAFFDSLAVPENRLLLPMAALSTGALVWSPTFDALAGRARVLLAGALACWAALSIWGPGETDTFVTENRAAPAFALDAEHSGAAVIVSPLADPVHWWTGIPAAYPPLPVRPVTGERVDIAALWTDLPCALLRVDGALLVPHGVPFDAAGGRDVERLVASGAWAAEEMSGSTLLWPLGPCP